MKKCEICGIENKRVCGKSGKYKMDLCSKHISQMDNHGKILEKTRFDPNNFIIEGNICKIEIIKDNIIHYAIIDKEDYELAKEYKWCFSNNGYVMNNGKYGNPIFLHSLILEKYNKEIYEGDHINRNKLDNTKNNLRLVSFQVNIINRGLNKNNTTGCKGLYFDRKNNKWQATIWLNKKPIYLGYFNTKEEAINARLKAEDKYYKPLFDQCISAEENRKNLL